jgi:hypothetical protein
MAAPPLDFTRLAALHRQALRDQNLVRWGIAVLIVSPLIGLAIGLAVFGWPQ